MLHRSRAPEFRAPFGAVPAGTTISLGVLLQPGEGENAAVILRLWSDEGETRLAMRNEGEGWWRGEVSTAGAPRLIWYWFELTDAQGRVRAWHGADANSVEGEGVTLDHPPESFQITVYDPAYRVPEWMRHAAMYQIMVDRFAVGKDGSYLDRRDDIVRHEDWYEPPFYVPEGRTADNAANDFYGGNLPGIIAKLPYLRELGVSVLYLNPIFRAASNHKYDTGDYHQIDPTYGDEDEFRTLCAEAAKLGIRVMLDGVFSHTGEDSRYFNRYGRYPGKGAYQSTKSKYASWYTFRAFPDDYECWWGVPTLPNVREEEPTYLKYQISGSDAVTRKWLAAGASGWRLDVADELPDLFLDLLREHIKRDDPDAAILGEVWEDASNKVSYGQMRRYLLGGQLDSVMNYPLRRALLDFMTDVCDANAAAAVIARLQENYPPQAFYSLMNHMGTHDRARTVNRLSGAEEPPKELQRGAALTPEQRETGLSRQRAMWLCLCCMPGMPALFYADEAGLEGWRDPYCRAAYPWGREDQEHLAAIKSALAFRNEHAALRTGWLRAAAPSPEVLLIERWLEGSRDFFGQAASGADHIVLLLNRSDKRGFAPLITRKKPALVLGRAGQTPPEAVSGGVILPAQSAVAWTL